MARRQPLQITMTAREVIAMGAPFRVWQKPFADADIALDEISTLRPRHEATVLRVTAVGGNAKERKRVAGDWLCDVEGDPPMRIPRPKRSHDPEDGEWSPEREWLDAWEDSADGRRMLDAARRVGVDPALLAVAACACARLALKFVPDGDVVPLRAIEAAEAWAERRAPIFDVRVAAFDAEHAAADYFARDMIPAYNAATAARYSGSKFPHAAATYAADALVETGQETQNGALRLCADLVRRKVPTVAVLRAVLTFAATRRVKRSS